MSRGSECTIPIVGGGGSPTSNSDDNEGAQAERPNTNSTLFPAPNIAQEHPSRRRNVLGDSVQTVWCTFDLLSAPFAGVSEGGVMLRSIPAWDRSVEASSVFLDTAASSNAADDRTMAGLHSETASAGARLSPPMWSAANVFTSVANMGPSLLADQPNNTSFMSLSFDSKPTSATGVAGRGMRAALGPALAAAYSSDERMQTSPNTRTSTTQRPQPHYQRASLQSPNAESPLRPSPRPSVADSRASRMSGGSLSLWAPTPTVRQGVKLIAATLHIRRGSDVDEAHELSPAPAVAVNVARRPCAVRLLQLPSALSDSRLRDVALQQLRALLESCTVDHCAALPRNASMGSALRLGGEASSSSGSGVLYTAVSTREWSSISAAPSEVIVVETRLSDTLQGADSSHDQMDPSNLGVAGPGDHAPLQHRASGAPNPDLVRVPLGLPVLQVHLSDAPTASRLGCSILSVVHPLLPRGNILERYRDWVLTARPSPADMELVIREVIRCCLVQLCEIHSRGSVHGNVKATNLFSWSDIQAELIEVKPEPPSRQPPQLSRHLSTRDTSVSRQANRSSQSLYDAAAEQAEGRRARRSAKSLNALSQEQRRGADSGAPPSWASDVVLVDGTYRRIESLVKHLLTMESHDEDEAPNAKTKATVNVGQSGGGNGGDRGVSSGDSITEGEKSWFQALQDDYVLPPECLADRATEGVVGSANSATGGAPMDLQPSWSSASSFPFSMSETVSNTDALLQSPSADIWNLGLTAIHLADGGFPPWLKRQARPLPSLSRSHWSRKFSSFVRSCVAMNPAQRPSPEKLLEDPWFFAVIAPSLPTDSGQVGINAALPPPPPAAEALVAGDANGGSDAERSPLVGVATATAFASPTSELVSTAESADLPRRHQALPTVMGVVPPSSYAPTHSTRPSSSIAIHEPAAASSPRRGGTTTSNVSALAGAASPSHAQRRTFASSAIRASTAAANSVAGPPSAASFASRPLRHLFGDSSDGSGTVFLPQRNVLRTCADMYVACLQHVASVHERLDAKQREADRAHVVAGVQQDVPTTSHLGAGGLAQGSSPAGSQPATRGNDDDKSDDGSGDDGGPPPPALAQTISGVALRQHSDSFVEDSSRHVVSAALSSDQQSPRMAEANHEAAGGAPTQDSGPQGEESGEDDVSRVNDEDIIDDEFEDDQDPHRHRLFLSSFLAAVETCRRETLSDMGYFVSTPSPATGEVIRTRSGAALTARQLQEVQLVEDRYVGLIQAFLDLHASSSISCDRWLIGILAATARHNLTQDCFIPVKSWWVDRLAAMHQRPLSVLTGRLGSDKAARTASGAATSLAGATTPSALLPSQRTYIGDTLRGVVRGGGGSSAGGAPSSGTTHLIGEPTPTECNDYLFCKWLTLASITVEER